MKWSRCAALAAAILLHFAAPAAAQWQVTNHNVPIGRGVGVTGFGSAAPGAAGTGLVSNGPGADPTFQPVPVPAPTASTLGGVKSITCPASQWLSSITTAGAPVCTPIAVALGSTALGTSSIASGACATAVTATATGVLTTDTVTVSFNGDPTAITGYIPSTSGMLTIFAYPTANNVNFKVCNTTSASITPGAVTLNWRVAR